MSVVIKDCFQCPSCLHNVEVVENGKRIAVTFCSHLMRNILKHEIGEDKWALFQMFWKKYGRPACFPAWCPRKTGKSRKNMEKLRETREDDFVSTF